MIRDPRDRYHASLTLWPNGKGRAGGATARWLYSLALAQRNLQKYPDRYQVVRFETLVRQPEQTLRDVCDFLGEAYVPAMLAMEGDPERRAAHVLNVTFPGVDGESLRFALRDVCVSAGSACAADSPEASHVLIGMGLSDVLAGSSMRFSLGRFTTEDDVVTAAARVSAAVARLRSLARSAPAWCSA